MSNDTPFEATELVRTRKPGFEPRVAMILGSGLGVLAEQMTDAVSMGFDELPGFPVSTVSGHAGELVLGTLAGVPVVCMKGRGHFYEGYGVGVMTNAVRTMKLLGCELLIVTNAAGSLRTEVDAGSLVVLTDHINGLPGTPLVGPNDDRFGPRFLSMANAYDATLRALFRQTAAAEAITLHDGVLIACPGPNFETAAEVAMMAKLGADVVGMSMVPEVISARHCGMKVLAVSVITNLAEGMSPFPLSHQQTLKYAALGASDLVVLIPAFLRRIAEEPRTAV